MNIRDLTDILHDEKSGVHLNKVEAAIARAYHQGKYDAARELQQTSSSNNTINRDSYRRFTDCLLKISDAELLMKLYKTKDSIEKVYEKAENTRIDNNNIRRLGSYYIPEIIELLKTYQGLQNEYPVTEELKQLRKTVMEGIDRLDTVLADINKEIIETVRCSTNVSLSVMDQINRQNGMRTD